MNVLFTLDEIAVVCRQLWLEESNEKIWAFDAPMGAGKTTLIHALCDVVLGVTDAVSSPTFAIINEYESNVAGTIYHMDFYRLKSDAEAIQAGIEDSILSGNLCLIEWAQNAAGLLPDNYLQINIEIINASTRRLYTTHINK